MNTTSRNTKELVQEILLNIQVKNSVTLNLEDSLFVSYAEKGLLNEKGQAMLQALHQKIMDDDYHPWLHNIKHLTIDHKGNVYWKMQVIEHLEFPWVNKPVGKKYLRELRNRCQILENQGRNVNIRSVVLEWKEPNTQRVRNLNPRRK